jgi:hypothetical protein
MLVTASSKVNIETYINGHAILERKMIIKEKSNNKKKGSILENFVRFR